jgi:peroxiredoxin
VTDLDRRFRSLDGIEAPDLWTAAEARARSIEGPEVSWWKHRPVAVAAIAALATIVAIGGVVWAISGITEAPVPPVAATAAEPGSIAEWSYPAAGVPPFHATMVWERNPDDEWRIGYRGSTATVEVWYEQPGRFRWNLIELDADLVDRGVPDVGVHLGGPGSFIVGDGSRAGQFFANETEWVEVESAFHYLSSMFWEPGDSEATFDWAATCGGDSVVLETALVAGRDARHIACNPPRGDWEIWVDIETGLILKLIGETDISDLHLGSSPSGGFEVTAIEFFDGPLPDGDDLFAIGPPAGAADTGGLRVGMPVPVFTGPLADGSRFELAALRGRPVIVFLWMDALRPGLLEQELTDFEILQAAWGDRVAFVSVPEMDATEARRWVERFPLTHSVVLCNGTTGNGYGNIACDPDSPASLWQLGWPAWVVIDDEGRVSDVRMGGQVTVEELDAMIAAVAGR